MPSTITSSDFSNQPTGGSLCDQFQQKLLNNGKMQTLLDYLFSDPDGEFASAFAADLVALLGDRVGSIKFFPHQLSPGEAAPDTGMLLLECNGMKHSIEDYPDLAGYLGAYYNSLTTRADEVLNTEFRVPDLTGRFLVGVGGGFSERTQGGEKNAELTIPDHIHVVGRYQATSGDKVNDLVLLNGSVDNDDVNSMTGRRAAIEHNSTEDVSGAGDFIITSNPMAAGGADVAKMSQVLPPHQTGVYYIVAGYRLRGTLL